MSTPTVLNHIDGRDEPAAKGATLEKRAPASGALLSLVARSGPADCDRAVGAAVRAQADWAAATPVERGRVLRRLATAMEGERAALAAIVADETGKSPAEAAGEVEAAVEMGYFVAGEGRRLYGRTTTSATPHRQASTNRRPVGVAALIVAANTPIANVAWKAFPALVCGNAAVLKASEDTPATAAAFAGLATEVGVPAGALNVLQGLGEEAGWPLVIDPRVDLVSFTGSTAVGRAIAGAAGGRLARVCLELGGKNPFVVCDDADLEGAAEAAIRSAFSNAGQRCAAGSRIIVFDAVYDAFRDRLLERADRLRVGPADGDDYGPVINEGQLLGILAALDAARSAGARVLCGGSRLEDAEHAGGYYLAPTLVEDAADLDGIELFGPVATLRRVSGFDEALEAAREGAYGLTAAIWTDSVHRAQAFVAAIGSGVASVNGPTFGSEPHLPFGGPGDSGNGWREAGTEAIDVYSELATVYVNHDPQRR